MLNPQINGKRFMGSAMIIIAAIGFAFYSARYGFSYREMIVAMSGLIAGVIVLGGERGITFGFVLWFLTFALGHRAVEVTPSLRIHPAEILLWLLFIIVLAQRRFLASINLTVPWWLYLFIPFWAVGWWPLILGEGDWDRMMAEFRNFVLFIPLLVVVPAVVRERRHWRVVLTAFFLTSTWMALLGVLEYWFAGMAQMFPDFIRAAKPEITVEGFARAQFSFWGGAHATFIMVLAVPMIFVLMTWWRQWYLRLGLGLAAALQMLGVYIGGYRSLWALLLVQVIVASILRAKRRGIAIVVLCLVVGFGGYQLIPNTTERALTGIAALRGQPVDHSARDRKERAINALETALSTPFGSGWGSAGWVHSDFLQVAVNLGIIPALLFLCGYLLTLHRLFIKARRSLRSGVDGDLALSLLLAFIAAGEHLAVQGVEVLSQLVLPVWFVWVAVEVWLHRTSEVPDPSYSYVPEYLRPVADLQ